MKKRVVLVDDHHIVRAGIRYFVERLSDYEVVAEGRDGEDVLPLVEEHQPDVLITDISMRRMSGLEALPEVKKQFPETAVIVLSMHNGKQVVRSAMEAGAQGYLVKDAAESEMELALDTVTGGVRYLSPQVSASLLDEVFSPPDPASEPSLTARQREILRLIALGRNTKQIAYELGVSNKTVESHRSQLMERLDIRDVASLVRYAIRNGIIDLDEDM